MTTPTLRFPEFVEPWHEARAGDAFTNSRTKGEAGLPIWSVTLDRGMVPRDSLDRHLESDAADELNLRAQPGDLVYNMMRMWQGAVGQATEECMVSPAYVVLSPKEGISSTFFDYWFNASRMLHRLRAYSHGLTKDRLRLYFADFAKIPLSLPSIEEQEKVSSFLTSVDEKICALRREAKALKEFRRGAMDAIFSREVRFTKNDGREFRDWDTSTLGEIGTFLKGKGISKNDVSEDGAIPCIRYGEIYTLYRERITEVRSRTDIPESQLVISRPGDVIIPASGEDRLDMARACCVVSGGVALGGDINILRSPVRGDFLAYYLNSVRRKEIARLGQGNSVVHIYPTHLKTLPVEIPEPEEQEKIVETLMEIDDKIDYVDSEVDRLLNFKKGLLQEMFV